MKTNCMIIQDLLPLYLDDVLSEESKKLVEEHINECEKCKELYEEMKQENIIPQSISEEKVMKKIRNQISFKTIFYCLFVLSFVVFWILFYNDLNYTHIHVYTGQYVYSSMHEFLIMIAEILPYVLVGVLIVYILCVIKLKKLKKNMIKILVLIVMIVFSQVTVNNELRSIIYSSYRGKLTNINKESVEIYNDSLIQLEIPEMMNPTLNLDTQYVIYYRYDKKTSQGIIDSIVEDTRPIHIIEDFKGLDKSYGNSYVQVLNLLNTIELSSVNQDVVHVHETSVDELELARNVYSSTHFVGEASDYWTYEIGYKVDLTSNYVAIVVRKDASGFVGKTGIGFIHFPRDN